MQKRIKAAYSIHRAFAESSLCKAELQAQLNWRKPQSALQTHCSEQCKATSMLSNRRLRSCGACLSATARIKALKLASSSQRREDFRDAALSASKLPYLCLPSEACFNMRWLSRRSRRSVGARRACHRLRRWDPSARLMLCEACCLYIQAEGYIAPSLERSGHKVSLQ